jgi:hypothetical protein
VEILFWLVGFTIELNAWIPAIFAEVGYPSSPLAFLSNGQGTMGIM